MIFNHHSKHGVRSLAQCAERLSAPHRECAANFNVGFRMPLSMALKSNLPRRQPETSSIITTAPSMACTKRKPESQDILIDSIRAGGPFGGTMSEPGPRPLDDRQAKFKFYDDSEWIWMDDRYWLGG